MTKATAIHIAVLLLCSNIAAAQNAPAPSGQEAGTEEIQKVVIVSTGSRGSQRTVIDSAVPIDILPSKELGKTGQNSLDKALGFRVPSFNTVQTPVNDATSLLDPYEIRNMGPSRALILINGKRKNSSALVYTQTSPGRGESGADISAIPIDAIKRIEVLRDGASAQYGSDAIAGVVNVILKDSSSEGAVTARAGMTGERDGKMGALSLNHGVSLGGKGFFNYTIDASRIGLASRSGKVDARGDADASIGFDAPLSVVQAFLAKYPDARNVNGSPKTNANKFLYNLGYDLSDDITLYSNAAYIKKEVFSFANYRTPYWRTTDFGLLHPAGTTYEGYQPTFIGALDDYNATVGVKFTAMGWTGDVSLTGGGNKQTYTVGNTINRAMGAASPTQFYAGGSRFEHTVFNADFSRQLTDSVNAYVGTEIRKESFTTIAGDAASYENGGADSFAGNDKVNSFKRTRDNKGVYAGAIFDVTPRFMIDATGRYEQYSDFGNAFVWKLSTRYKAADSVTLRGSLSTGFRAPSLHQIYTQRAQYSFAAGNIEVTGLVNNVSTQARALQVPLLDAEKSTNFTVGLGFKPSSNTSLTVDYYNIAVEDRIILGKEIKPTGNASNPLDVEMAKLGIKKVSFFINGLDSRTSGIDYVFSQRNMSMLGGKLALNLSGNYTHKNERDGAVKNTKLVADANQTILDATQEALLFTSRPKHKNIIGLDLDYSKFAFSLNNTVFGPTQFRNADLDNTNLAVRFKTKMVTDFGVNYNFNDRTTFSFNINNVFDVTPEWRLKALTAAGATSLASTAVDPASGMTYTETQKNLITFNQRYSMVTYDGSHFSQLGRTFNASLNYRF
ncbi:MAG: TonB-dependent receptor [Pseudomonadota bacterium]